MQIVINLHPGNPGEEQNIQILLQKLSEAGYSTQEEQDSNSFHANGKLIVADTKTKRYFFLNSYFPTVYGFMNNQERPVSLSRALMTIETLLINDDRTLLKALYCEEFREYQKR